jgi:hypothetical protein
MGSIGVNMGQHPSGTLVETVLKEKTVVAGQQFTNQMFDNCQCHLVV